MEKYLKSCALGALTSSLSEPFSVAATLAHTSLEEQLRLDTLEMHVDSILDQDEDETCSFTTTRDERAAHERDVEQVRVVKEPRAAYRSSEAFTNTGTSNVALFDPAREEARDAGAVQREKNVSSCDNYWLQKDR